MIRIASLSDFSFVFASFPLEQLLLNNAKLILDWRQVIIKNLRLVVNRDVSQENEEDDQYQENLDAQVEAETVLEMFRVLLAEREKIIAGTTSVGATSKPSLYVSLEHQMANIKRQRHGPSSKSQIVSSMRTSIRLGPHPLRYSRCIISRGPFVLGWYCDSHQRSKR